MKVSNTKLSAILMTVAFLTSALVHAKSENQRSPASSELQNKINATIKTNADCKKLGQFYYELGNGSTIIESGSVGDKYNRNTSIDIASSSKWIMGAYTLEKLKGQIPPAFRTKLQMMSGYTKINNTFCANRASTVQECYQGGVRETALNSPYVARNAGSFFYSGAHAQALAVQPQIGLGSYNEATLGAAVRSLLNITDLTYSAPQLAGGGVMTADAYARFLQNIINNKYYISKSLASEQGVCGNTKYCSNVKSTPAPKDENWWYGLHYWIEKDATGKKVDAFSSAGLYGFYPWITADRKFYGLIAREDRNGLDGKAYVDSAKCGKALRQVFQANY